MSKRSLVALILLLTLCSVFPDTLLTEPRSAAASVRTSDFDAVAFKYDTGESVQATGIGLQASPAPVHRGAVNFLLQNDAMPLYFTEGPAGGGTVAFGFINSQFWRPSDRDGNDLTESANPIGDRVYVTVDGAGKVELISAANFSSGVAIATANVALDPDKAFRLVIEPHIDWAYVYYGTAKIAQGNPFPGTPESASRANLGKDMVISVLAGPTDTGTATINNLARNPRLMVHEFPRILSERATTPPVRVSRGADILLSRDRADVLIYLHNGGSRPATNVQATLSVPGGRGFTITGSPTRDYGTIAAGQTVARAFALETAGTTPGVYPFTLAVTGGITQTLQTYVPVWDVNVTITDATAGTATATAATPWGQHAISAVAPEVVDANREPTHFDIQRITHRAVHAIPFVGTHYGQPEELPGQPAPMMTESAGTGSAVGPQDAPHGLGLHSDVGNVTGQVLRGQTWDPCYYVPETVQGAVVQLRSLPSGAVVATTTTNEHGEYTFGPVPYGAYQIALLGFSGDHPWLMRPFELGRPVYRHNEIRVACPPKPASNAPNTPPNNGQGQTGQRTEQRDPLFLPPDDFLQTGQGTAGSAVTGFTTGIILDLVNYALAPETFGASLLSMVAANGGATALGVFVDPADADLFYFGRSQTPPQDPDELTQEEYVEVEGAIAPPPSFTAPSTITTKFTYTRTTDQRTYTYSGGETLTLDRYLPTTMTVNRGPGGTAQVRATLQTAQGDSLRGPDAMVEAWLLSGDGKELLGQTLLFDDGQGNDGAAGDGAYTGLLPASCAQGMQVMVYATRRGFFLDNFPVSHGLARQTVDTGPFCPRLQAPSDGAALTDFSPNLTWSTPAGTTQYHIQVLPFNNDGPGINLIRNVESSYTVPPPIFGQGNYVMLPGMTYQWRVRTTDKATFAGEQDPAWGGWTAWRTFRTPAVTSATISLPTPVPGSTVTTRTPVLVWQNSNPNVFYYEVQVSPDPDFGPNAFLYWELRHGAATTPPNSYTIPDAYPLEPGTTYYWRVRPRIQGDGTPVDWTPAASFRAP